MKHGRNRAPVPIRDFEKQGALQILVYLYENKERKINVSELERNVKAHRATILTTLEMLKTDRVIEEKINAKFPFDHSVWLSQLGEEVGAQFAIVAKSLLGRVPPYNKQDIEHVK